MYISYTFFLFNFVFPSSVLYNILSAEICMKEQQDDFNIKLMNISDSFIYY